MRHSNTGNYDLIVIGGGPAGSTLATFVAMQGHNVLLLEKERFPRYQIGESLLPSTVHGICTMLGVGDQIKNASFTLKRGGTFRWGKNSKPWTFAFALSQALSGPTSYAYQVERSKFDSILLTNARDKGVEVHEGYAVTDIILEGERAVGVRFRDEHGIDRTAHARYIGAAAGNTSHLYRSLGGAREYSEFFKNVALFCYFDNGKRLPAPNEGNILCAAFRDGWFWYIPLSPTLTSVGAVIAREHASKIHDLGQEAAMANFIASCPIIGEYLASAKRVTDGQYGQFRIRKDYSYCNTRFWRPGMVAVGDAACFVDPVFSSGVHLATYAALLAARSINTCLEIGMSEEQSFTEFEMRYRREYGVFYQFLTAFYDMDQDEDSYFWQARKVVQTSDTDLESFVNLVAGVSSSGEPVFASGDDFRRGARSIRESLENEAQQTSEEGGELSEFMVFSEAGKILWRESREIRVKANMQGRHAIEKPLLDGGLIVSADGLHWALPSEASLAYATA